MSLAAETDLELKRKLLGRCVSRCAWLIRKPVKNWKTHAHHAKTSRAVIVVIVAVHAAIAAAAVTVVVAVMVAATRAVMTAQPQCPTS